MDKEFAQEWDAPHAIDARSVIVKHHPVALKQIVTIRLDTDMLEWFKAPAPVTRPASTRSCANTWPITPTTALASESQLIN